MRIRSLFQCWLLAISALALLVANSCNSLKFVAHGGTVEQEHPHRPPSTPIEPHVLIFAFDGAGYDQLMTAIKSGKAPRMAALLGHERGNGVYEHAYSAPNALSILPSTTIAAWSSIFTGAAPAYHGVTGNEWFAREEAHFYAPVPVSITDTNDTNKMVMEDLVGNQEKTRTLFQQARVKSYVSLNPVYRGADMFTTVEALPFVAMMSDFVRGNLTGGHGEARRQAYAQLDQHSVSKLLDADKSKGFPVIQVVYFPGIDLYTHLARGGLTNETEYLEQITDPLLGQVVDAYRRAGLVDNTYVVIVADHGHTPVLKDNVHAIGYTASAGPVHALRYAGFRPRAPKLVLSDAEQDYQAVVAYQGAMAYVYLANRTSCPKRGEKCNWKLAPRMKQDVMPLIRAFYGANKYGKRILGLKGKLDLIFARQPVAPGKDSLPFEIFDGHRLVPIPTYLAKHPRPDLLALDRRMRWLGVGPYGDHAGDIVLLTKSGLDRPIEDRYYFSAPYHSWHGSPSAQDSHIPLIVAQNNTAGAQLRKLVMDRATDPEPSQLDVTPIVLELLKTPTPPPQPEPAAPRPGPTMSATPAPAPPQPPHLPTPTSLPTSSTGP
ncbi:MAG TPA: alkaline phosphatase family protein [Candidatus Binataceae bacterium]|nr:alkaline phosphatase family protein [Candidatus Binataceae bacterium]